LLDTIPRYIGEVEEVILGLDKYRQTWSGSTFEIPDGFFEKLKALDHDKKVRIIEENFYIPDFSPLDNDTRERNYLSNLVRSGNWIISFDADDFITDIAKVKDFLASLVDDDVCVFLPGLTIFKQFADSVLIARTTRVGRVGVFPIATRAVNSFIGARYTPQLRVDCPVLLLHNSWGRSEDELLTKLKNWGHSNHFDVDSYFAFWKRIDEDNYGSVRNFHPIWPEEWVDLIKVSNEDIRNLNKLQEHFQSSHHSW
jgi:hypothetical protein